MQITASLLREVNHTVQRLTALANQYGYTATGQWLCDEGDYQDFEDQVINIVLDLVQEVNSGQTGNTETP